MNMDTDTDSESEDEAAKLSPSKSGTSYETFGLSKIPQPTDYVSQRLKFFKGNVLSESQILKDSVYLLKFQKLLCMRYVHSGKKDQRCSCGRPRHVHHGSALHTVHQEPWDKVTDTKAVQTNAYGRILFKPDGVKFWNTASYTRLALNHDASEAFKYMVHIWGLKEPNFLLSVVGASKGYKGPMHVEGVLKRGLLKVAEMTGGWVITGGTETGIRSIIGKLSREIATIKNVEHEKPLNINDFPFKCIGITAWAVVKNRAVLKNDGRDVIYAHTDVIKHKGREAFLDRNHQYFFLVDDGRVGQFDGEIEFRGRLESYIAENKQIPCVQLMVGGGSGTINAVYQALVESRVTIPVVVFAGSGRAADVLAGLYRWWRSRCENVDENLERLFEDEVLLQIRRHIYPRHLYPEQNANLSRSSKVFRQAKRCILMKYEYITLFDIDSGADDFDKAVLEAILKGDKLKVKAKLKQAQLWNNAELAKTEVLKRQTKHDKLTMADLEEEMDLALHGNKPDFVQLFMSNGIDLGSFLTESKLCSLYKNHLKGSRWDSLKQSLVDTNALPAVRRYLYDSCGIEHSIRMINDNRFEYPYFELFCWALLCHYFDMAKLFWKEGDFGLSKAVIGHRLLRCVAESASKDYAYEETVRELENQSRHFQDLSCSLLDECMYVGKAASQLLSEELPFWSQKNCLSVAAAADNKKFLAHSSCQDLLGRNWCGELRLQKFLHVKVVLSCLFLPLLGIPFIFTLSYRQRSESRLEQTAPPPSDEKPDGSLQTAVVPPDSPPDSYRWWEKIRLFWIAPISKYWMSVLCYVGFLLLFGYIVIRKLEEKITVVEYVVIGLAFSYFLEEVREVLHEDASSVREKVRLWLSSFWNLMDLLGILLFATALGLRLHPSTLMAGHFLYALDLMVWIVRILDLFSASAHLGPYVVMVGKMLVDLFMFLFIFVVFLLAYCLARYSVLYPYATAPSKQIYDILFVPFMEIFGNYFLDYPASGGKTIFGTPDYSGGAPWIVTILLAAYLVITQILLLNIIIAKFNNTFNNILGESNTVWKYQRYALIREYARRPILPPPLVSVYMAWIFMCWFCSCCKRGCTVYSFASPQLYGDEQLRVFENNCRDMFLRKSGSDDERDVGLQAISERIATVEENMRLLGEFSKRCERAIADLEPAREASNTAL